MRGGERCLEVFGELFLDAPLYTLLHTPGLVSPNIERRTIHTSFIQRLPDAERRYRHYLPLFPAAIRRFDLQSKTGPTSPKRIGKARFCPCKRPPAPTASRSGHERGRRC